MHTTIIRPLSGGANQSGLRDYNERLILSMLLRNGEMPGSDIARRSGLSPQTVSVILRKLENDGLLARGAPTRGKVGKPSVPLGLAPNGVFSIGLKIGRRSAELLLIDFLGQVRKQLQMTYRYPLPGDVLGFLEGSLGVLTEGLHPDELQRICGIGIAIPHEIWTWHDLVGAPEEEIQKWKNTDLRVEIARFSALPVLVTNDATSACRAEHVYGRGKEFRDYAYFFIAAFVGGGVVLNHSVFEGHHGNAGALGSLRSTGPNGESRQLVDIASLHALEARLLEAGVEPGLLWKRPQNWSAFSHHVGAWVGETAQELAKAALSTCAVIDFEAIIIDGAFPEDVKLELVERTRRYLVTQDVRGLIIPRIEEGTIGGNARAIGAACGPVFAQYFLNTNAGLSVI